MKPANRVHLLWIIPLFVLAVSLSLSGCKKEELRRQLDEYLIEARRVWGFHGTALVAWDGNVILNKGYGLANREFGELNSPDTKFYLGSITKQFTAAAILMLQQQKKLDINVPISRYLPDYPHENGDKITIHNLLTHTSGVPDYTLIPEILLNRSSRVSPGEIMESFSHWPLQFEPGTDFQYSNSNYIVLGAIIEEVSGQSYEAYLHHHILGPLGMDNTGYARREAGIPQRAKGYTTTENQRVVDAVPIHHSVLHTAGALYSTTGDMLHWDSALSHARVLSEESIEAMLTPYVANYGYGWVIDTLYGRRHTFHGGFIDGFNAIIERWPDHKLLVVVFSNEDFTPVKKIARGLAAIVFGEDYDFPRERTPIHIDPDRLAEYQGVYQTGPNRYRYVFMEDDTLHTHLTGEQHEHIFPQAVDSFFFDTDNTRKLVFLRNGSGRVNRVVVVDQEGAFLAERVPPDEEERLLVTRRAIRLDPDIYNHYAGVYRMKTMFENRSDDFNLTVERRGDRLYVQGQHTDPVELFPRTPTDFFHRSADFQLSFNLDRDGKVTGCVLQMAGATVLGEKIK